MSFSFTVAALQAAKTHNRQPKLVRLRHSAHCILNIFVNFSSLIYEPTNVEMGLTAIIYNIYATGTSAGASCALRLEVRHFLHISKNQILYILTFHAACTTAQLHTCAEKRERDRESRESACSLSPGKRDMVLYYKLHQIHTAHSVNIPQIYEKYEEKKK